MKIMNYEELEIELNEGLGEGDLTLGIYCKKCNAQFELNRESAAMAIITKTSFIDYLKYVQQSKCPKCNKEQDEKTKR